VTPGGTLKLRNGASREDEDDEDDDDGDDDDGDDGGGGGHRGIYLVDFCASRAIQCRLSVALRGNTYTMHNAETPCMSFWWYRERDRTRPEGGMGRNRNGE